MSFKVPLADVALEDPDLDAVMEVYSSGWLTMDRPPSSSSDYVGVRAQATVSLPLFPHMTDEQQALVVSAVRRHVQGSG